MTELSASRWRRIEELFDATLEVAPAARHEFLQARCKGDDALRAEVESLLVAHDSADFFFESPARPDAELPPPALRPGSRIGPYRLEHLLGRGGMGAVYEAIADADGARVAVKIVRAEDLVDPHRQRLFRREAQSLARLDHPGIARLLDQGQSADGQRWFAMELVAGRPLSDHVRQRGVSRRERLRLFLELCSAIDYAHGQGVVHRDLKPSNVLVVEAADAPAHVKVLDFGLARLDGALAAESATTEPGRILGTLAYMSPEQALGDPAAVGAQSDVYSLGVILYELLTGALPVEVSGVLLPEAVRLVCEREPERPSTYDHVLRGDLDTIVLRALEKEPRRRYASVRALAADVENQLAGRPIVARPPSALQRFVRVVERNKIVFGAASALLVLATATAIVSSILYARAARAERLATRKANDVLSLSAMQEIKDLRARADELWPATPERIPAYELWLEDARVLIEGTRADPGRGTEAHPGLADHRAKLSEIRSRALRGDPSGDPVFEDAGDRWWHAQLTQLVADLEDLADPRTGLYSDGISERHGWGVPKRAEFARSIGARSLQDADARQRWSDAIDSIRSSAAYGGLVLAPIAGLIPIGADPDSHLWEFAHLQTGEPATRDAHGRLVLTEATGLVFVLLPGGSFLLGAQSVDPGGPNYDPRARVDESPVNTVALAAWLLSKYEMTQGQWLRFTNHNPSQYVPAETKPEWSAAGLSVNLLHPVDRISFSECSVTLARLGLTLPTEAQWEYAARAGTHTAWWTGDTVESLAGAANLADRYGKEHGANQWPVWEPSLDDGWTVHAAIGSYRANPFGLHDLHGNVMEWCRDAYGTYDLPVRPGDGERLAPPSNTHVHRGGGFNDTAVDARCSDRSLDTPGLRHDLLGLRPAMRIAP